MGPHTIHYAHRALHQTWIPAFAHPQALPKSTQKKILAVAYMTGKEKEKREKLY